MIIKKILLALFLTFSMVTMNTAFAEKEKAEATVTANDTAAIVAHIEAALPSVDIKHSDPSSAIIHIKAALVAAEKLQGDKKALDDARNSLFQALRKVKTEDLSGANQWLHKAIDAYKAIK